MRRIFKDAGFLEPEKHGYTVIPEDGGPPGDGAPEDAVLSRMLIYFDRFGRPVAAAHEYLRSDGTRTASGMPDPKRVLVGRTQYVLRG